MSHERIETDLPMTYTVRVDLQDYQGRDQEPLEYVLDLNFRYGRRECANVVNEVAATESAIASSKTATSQLSAQRVLAILTPSSCTASPRS